MFNVCYMVFFYLDIRLRILYFFIVNLFSYNVRIIFKGE